MMQKIPYLFPSFSLGSRTIRLGLCDELFHCAVPARVSLKEMLSAR